MEEKEVLKILMDRQKELLEGGSESKAYKRITREIIKSESKRLSKNISVKRGEAWSALANQVVGSEDF